MKYIDNTGELNHNEIEQLISIVESGPTWDGDLIHRTLANKLLEKGYAVSILNHGQSGFTAATMVGQRKYFSLFGNANNMPEAIANRNYQRVFGKPISDNLYPDLESSD